MSRTVAALLLLLSAAACSPRNSFMRERRVGATPLHFAAAKNNVEMAALLLQHGANVNRQAVGKDGWVLSGALVEALHITSLLYSRNTSLDWALYHKHKAMVDLLLSHGVSFCGQT